MKITTKVISFIAAFAFSFAAHAYSSDAQEHHANAFYLGEIFVDKGGNQAYSVEQINDNNFSEKTSHGVVVVDFYAPWCGPCRSFAPTFAKVAQELQGSVSFYKVNTDESPKTSSKAKVSSIPTMILYKNGVEVNRNVGGFNESDLKKFVLSAH